MELPYQSAGGHPEDIIDLQEQCRSQYRDLLNVIRDLDAALAALGGRAKMLQSNLLRLEQLRSQLEHHV